MGLSSVIETKLAQYVKLRTSLSVTLSVIVVAIGTQLSREEGIEVERFELLMRVCGMLFIMYLALFLFDNADKISEWIKELLVAVKIKKDEVLVKAHLPQEFPTGALDPKS